MVWPLDRKRLSRVFSGRACWTKVAASERMQSLSGIGDHLWKDARSRMGWLL